MEYQAKYPDKIIVTDGASTGGAKQNFLYLFSQVEAPLYMCCDQDDVWLTDKIELTKHEMENLMRADEDKPCLVFTELCVVDQDLNLIAQKMSEYQGLDCTRLKFNRALIQNVVTGCTMMVNRVLRDELEKIEDSSKVLMHDWWALLVASRFGKVAFVDHATILYRQHGNNGVGASHASSFGYKLKRMLQGKAIQQSLENTREQAECFADVYGEPEDSLTRRYATLAQKNKLVRLAFYQKYDIKKSTGSKNFGLMIWG